MRFYQKLMQKLFSTGIMLALNGVNYTEMLYIYIHNAIISLLW